MTQGSEVSSLFARRRPKLAVNVQVVRAEEKLLSNVSDEVGERFAAEYEVLEVLGQGSASVVKRAKVRQSGLEVALKITRSSDAEQQQMARNEFNLIRHLDHPNITKVYDFFAARHQTILVVEFFNARDLQEAVRSSPGRQLPEETCRSLIGQLFEALDFLHQHRIIHRDVKPQNVLVSDSMANLKLIDFNVARRLEEGGSLTMTGTVQYAAPEVLLRESASDCADVWAAGLCLHYMLVGALPFRIEDFNNNPQDFGEHISQHPVSLSGKTWEEVSELCKTLLRQCLAVDMAARPAPMTLLKSEWLAPKTLRRPLGAGVFVTEHFLHCSKYEIDEGLTVFDTAPM